MKKMHNSAVYVAVDLGSNTFHLSVMQADNGRLIVIDRLREMVQLSFGIDEEMNLDDITAQKAFACLSRFNERLQGIHPDHIRVVGTSALRTIRNQRYFLQEAEKYLKMPIDIISGREEARLIYLGVSQHVEKTEQALLVIDIGGGSTEFIFGKNCCVNITESLNFGCVRLSKAYVVDQITPKIVANMCLKIETELQPYLQVLHAKNRQVIGTSGTIKVIAQLLTQEGFEQDNITFKSINALLQRCLMLKEISVIQQYYKVSPERARILPASIVILWQLFKSLAIETLQFVDIGMREGIVLDLMGRNNAEDMRDRTIHSLIQRFGADLSQAQRVTETVLTLASLTQASWKISAQYLRYLSWAAHLHEIGLAVSHTQYHRHGAYLIKHADLDGLSQLDQYKIAILVRYHRRRIHLKDYVDFPEVVLHLTILLRISVILHRNRVDEPKGIQCILTAKNYITLTFQPHWFADHPLLVEDLKSEEKYLRDIGFILQWQ